MTRAGSVALAICLAVATAASMTTSTVAYAQQAKAKVSKAVGEPLNAAKAAVEKRQFDTALAEIKKAQAVEKKTPVEEYQIDEFLAYIYNSQKKYPDAAKVYERTLTSTLMTPDRADERTKVISQLYFEAKDYKKTIEWTKRWLEKHKGQEAMTAQLAFAHFLSDDFKSAAAVMAPLVNAVEKSGRPPNEDHVKLLLNAYYKTDNKEGITDALKKMVRYFPKPEYWDKLVDLYRGSNDPGRVTLGYFRLMNQVGVLKRKGDYVEMAQLGLENGVPGESEQIVESGMAKGILKSTDKSEQGRYDRVLAAAKKQAATNKAGLAQVQKDADKSTTGQIDVGLGQAYMSYGRLDEAIASLERGIKKGGVTDLDEANVSLGIAYLRKGQKEPARQAFKNVKAGSKWAGLAELWTLQSQSNA